MRGPCCGGKAGVVAAWIFLVQQHGKVRAFGGASRLLGRPLVQALFSTTTAQAGSPRLFNEDLNIIYDSKCNVCKWEIDFLRRRDQKKNSKAPRLRFTDLEDDAYNPNYSANAGIDYKTALSSMHAVQADGKVLTGVPVFYSAYKAVGLGWLWVITQQPVIKQIADWLYNLFAKYRTNMTRRASIDALVQMYQEKKALQSSKAAQQEDCETCRKTDCYA